MSFWTKLGKFASIAAPIAAAPFTGGASLALIGAASGAANAALNKKGIKGMLLGAGMGAIPGVGKGLGGKIGGQLGNTVSKLAGGGAIGGAASGAASGAAGAAAGGAGSVMSKLLNSNTLAAAGKGIASVAQANAHNRGVKLDAMMAGDNMTLENEQQRMLSEADIMKKLQQTNYLKSGGFQDPGAVTSASGKPLTKFDFGTRPAGATEMAASTELEKQLMSRLHNPNKLRDYDSQMNPSKTETAMNWLGPIISTLGAAQDKGYQVPQVPTPNAPPAALPAFQLPPLSNAAGRKPFERPLFGVGNTNG